MSDFLTGLFGLGFGLLIVFFGITLLIFFIWLMSVILKAVKSKKQGAAAVSEAQAAPEANGQAEQSDGEIPDDVRAAIIAAVTACYRVNEEKCYFTVKKIKRIR